MNDSMDSDDDVLSSELAALSLEGRSDYLRLCTHNVGGTGFGKNSVYTRHGGRNVPELRTAEAKTAFAKRAVLPPHRSRPSTKAKTSKAKTLSTRLLAMYRSCCIVLVQEYTGVGFLRDLKHRLNEEGSGRWDYSPVEGTDSIGEVATFWDGAAFEQAPVPCDIAQLVAQNINSLGVSNGWMNNVDPNAAHPIVLAFQQRATTNIFRVNNRDQAVYVVNLHGFSKSSGSNPVFDLATDTKSLLAHAHV